MLHLYICYRSGSKSEREREKDSCAREGTLLSFPRLCREAFFFFLFFLHSPIIQSTLEGSVNGAVHNSLTLSSYYAHSREIN